MVLPGATLFPGALLPLHIFELRYRAMLAWCLDQQRMFCIAMMKPGIEEASSLGDFHHIAGLGLVRACVARPNGTSNLVLQGLARVRFTAFSQEKPFRIAELEELRPRPADAVQADALCARVLELCDEQRAHGLDLPAMVSDQLAQVSAPDLVSDIVAHTFLRDGARRQDVLERIEVVDRLHALIRHLSEEMPG